MDTISVLLVNGFICGGLMPLLFGCFGIEGYNHLRWCVWFWNKISDRRDSHCLRLLGNFISNEIDYQDRQRFGSWLTVYRLYTVSVPDLFAKVNTFWEFLLRLELRSGLSRDSQMSPFRRRRTVLYYNTGIFDKNLSPVRE